MPEIHPANYSPTKLLELLEAHPHTTETIYKYGTAGFRFDASLLPPIMVRVGVVATLWSVHQAAPVGCMVTASHNDESYNGVKLTNADGGMMTGETMAVDVANEREVSVLVEQIASMQSSLPESFVPTLHLAHDTRSHSPHLAGLVRDVAVACGCRVLDHGVVTTPMLHHAVLHGSSKHYVPLLIPLRPSGYYELLVQSYHALLQTAGKIETPTVPLVVDAACGVGYEHAQALGVQLQALSKEHRTIQVVNAPGAGPLNDQCGSEHVQKALLPPQFYDGTPKNTSYCASLDGDADRIVFFGLKNNDEMTLLDGDKIACLLVGFLQQEWQALNEGCQDLPSIRLGVVQTAYANGASTAYLESILSKDQIAVAKTGVKHVHHACAKLFDVGVYFEANGHGTVLFQSQFYASLAAASMQLWGKSGRAVTALQRLSVLPSLINQAVGDALSDLLVVDAVLQLQGLDVESWNALYQDLPSRQGKVLVKDRTMIQTNANETKCEAPAALQAELEAAMAKVQGRAFVRPSGTEDVVRVYAEAPSREQADLLATQAADIVHRLCEGTADVPPSFP